ncbi:hypothetical protein PC116_g30851 [Phytophthora cactorum]|nr:hypothetical protein PC116_g30851 [Phytophthora cactorum]
MCVCNDCIKSNNISPDYASSTDWCACPVCMADIRLILPHSGKEEERYWRWALEIKPNLPSQFKQEFKEAGKRLKNDVSPTRGPRSQGEVATVQNVAASNEQEEARNCSILMCLCQQNRC